MAPRTLKGSPLHFNHIIARWQRVGPLATDQSQGLAERFHCTVSDRWHDIGGNALSTNAEPDRTTHMRRDTTVQPVRTGNLRPRRRRRRWLLASYRCGFKRMSPPLVREHMNPRSCTSRKRKTWPPKQWCGSASILCGNARPPPLPPPRHWSPHPLPSTSDCAVFSYAHYLGRSLQKDGSQDKTNALQHGSILWVLCT